MAEAWEAPLDLDKVEPGSKVRHNNPELADWRGTVVPTTRTGKFVAWHGDAGAYVRVAWQSGPPHTLPQWVGATAIRLEASDG